MISLALILSETSDDNNLKLTKLQELMRRTSSWLVEETRTVVGKHGFADVNIEKSVVNGIESDSRRRTVKSE